MKECRELLRRCQELTCLWKSFKNPSANSKPLKGIQVTVQHSPVDKLMEMTSPVAIWLLEHKNT